MSTQTPARDKVLPIMISEMVQAYKTPVRECVVDLVKGYNAMGTGSQEYGVIIDSVELLFLVASAIERMFPEGQSPIVLLETKKGTPVMACRVQTSRDKGKRRKKLLAEGV